MMEVVGFQLFHGLIIFTSAVKLVVYRVAAKRLCSIVWAAMRPLITSK